ncbi:flagellin, partial [Halobacteriales archaeon QH_2_66_30]
MKQLLDDDRRGQVGIGTLIVFIAMVLVAAIAAGVLINTAGFLQNQAEDTGTESTEQVADNLNVITEVGVVGDGSAQATSDQIGEIRVGVQPASGADDINLAELTVQYVSDNDFANLVALESGDTSPSSITAGVEDDSGTDVYTYGIDVITAENDDDVVMTDNADRYEIIINTDGKLNSGPNSDTDELGPLDEGGEVELTITTGVGSQTVAFLQ